MSTVYFNYLVYYIKIFIAIFNHIVYNRIKEVIWHDY